MHASCLSHFASQHAEQDIELFISRILYREMGTQFQLHDTMADTFTLFMIVPCTAGKCVKYQKLCQKSVLGIK